jgi:hypothetical protein
MSLENKLKYGFILSSEIAFSLFVRTSSRIKLYNKLDLENWFSKQQRHHYSFKNYIEDIDEVITPLYMLGTTYSFFSYFSSPEDFEKGYTFLAVIGLGLYNMYKDETSDSFL